MMLPFSNRTRRCFIGFAIGLCLVFGVGGGGAAVGQSMTQEPSPPLAQLSGQLPGAPALPTPNLTTNGSKPPAQVKRLGSIEVAPVVFASRPLFMVAAPTVVDRQNPGEQMPVEWRAEMIENSLLDVLEPLPRVGSGLANWSALQPYQSAYDPQTFRVEVAKLNNQTILIATDDKHANQPLTLLTVTALDARYYSTSVDALAERWQETLQMTLGDALNRRQPEIVRQQVQRALVMAAAMVGTSLLLWLLHHLLRRRQKQLEARHQAEVAATVPAVAEGVEGMAVRSQFLEGLHQQFTLERRLGLLGLLQWLTVWGQALVWLGGLYWIHALFPETTPFFEALSTRLLTLLVIWFTIGLLNRIGSLVIDRLARAWEDNEFLLLEDDQRRSLRIPTIVRSLKGFKTFAVYLFGLGWALSVLGVSLSSVLTLSAIVALAISFASQSLVKDLVNGFLILLEDQFAIGDYVTLGPVSGLVENLNLRITQLRDVEGRLITIPNSQISLVENWTRIWSRIDFNVTVDYSADIQKTLTLIGDTAQALYSEPYWNSKILEPPQLLGVDRMGHEGMVIKLWIITKPMQQFEVRREMNRRVRIALEDAGIQVGRPQQISWHHPLAASELEHSNNGEALGPTQLIDPGQAVKPQ